MRQKLQQPRVHYNSPRAHALRRWFHASTLGELTLCARRWPRFPLIAGQGRAAP